MEKSAGIALEFKDLDTSKRQGVIKHSVYTSVDLVDDISAKGMFTKSWSEGLPQFWYNHERKQKIGNTIAVRDDDYAAFTEVKFGTWTLANDVMEMAEAGVLEGASFGYKTIRSVPVEMKGRKVRKLTEVKHIETSLLSVPPAHPEAGLVSLIKSIDELEEDDITQLLIQGGEHVQFLKSYVQKIESYCRKAHASDDTIISLQNGLLEYKQIISSYDTAITQLIPAPVASDDGIALTNFINHINIETWKIKQSLSN